MSLEEDLFKSCCRIIDAEWKPRNGNLLPDVDAVALQAGAVDIQGSVMYADLANSTRLVDESHTEFAAHVTKTFLFTAAQLIKRCDGVIRSFDGDRVMGVFVGASHANRAAKAAFALASAKDSVILSSLRRRWHQWSSNNWQFGYSCGLDTGAMTIIRAGVRGDNDLICLGSSANHAAKLSARRDLGYHSFATNRFVSATSYQRNTDNSPTWRRLTNGDCYGSASTMSLDRL
jgi:adenylate cyclase